MDTSRGQLPGIRVETRRWQPDALVANDRRQYCPDWFLFILWTFSRDARVHAICPRKMKALT